MSETIFKFLLEPQIMLPDGAAVLHVGEQNDKIYLWIRLDPHRARSIARHFTFVGTGHEIPPDPQAYLGTVHIGPFVWHVFETT